jgi:hypothetical protein
MASCLFPAYHHSPRTTCWVRSGILDLVNYFEIETALQAFRIVAVHHRMNARDGNSGLEADIPALAAASALIAFPPIETICRANATIVFRKQLL